MFYDDCLQISIANLKRMGYFVPDGVMSGVLTWGNTTSSIRVLVDNTNRIVLFDYIVNGERHMKYKVSIFEVEANIGKGVVMYFDCPITHNLCRKLYLCDGVFVSRKAIRGAMYRCQAQSKFDRAIPNGSGSDDFIPYKPYGKTHYRGKLTPYGKRIKRYQEIARRSEILILNRIMRFLKL